MVSVNFASTVDSADRLYQSVDFAINELLSSESEPLALAFYLWVLGKHRHSLVNLNLLSKWGLALTRRVFLERNVGRRRDEDVASAALALISLVDSKELESEKEAIRNEIERLLESELDLNPIPFKQPVYGILLLLAGLKLGLTNRKLVQTAILVGCNFAASIPSGRLFGLVFAAELLELVNNDCVERLESEAFDLLDDSAVDFEDHVYSLQALWYLRKENNSEFIDEELMLVSQSILDKTPVWQYLMHGVEDIPPANDGFVNLQISNLYRAALLDVVLQHRAFTDTFNNQQIDRQYRGRVGVGWSAFGFYLLSFLIVWATSLYFLIPQTRAAVNYWIAGDNKAMSSFNAVYYLAGILWGIYLAILSYMILPAAYSIFIKSKIESDRRIKDILFPLWWKATKMWLFSVFLALIFGLVGEWLGPTTQQLFKPGAWSNQVNSNDGNSNRGNSNVQEKQSQEAQNP